MTAMLVTLAEAVETAINTAKSGTGLVYTTFQVQRTWLPQHRLVELATTTGKVWIVGLASDDEGDLSRTNMARKELPIQVAVQRAVEDPTSVAGRDLIDNMIELEEQIRDICRKDVKLEGYSWFKTEALKDENKTPYSFVSLREGSVFESYFTAFYRATPE